MQTGVRRAGRKSRSCFSVPTERGERLPASLQPAPRHIAKTITDAHSLTLQNPGSTRASRLTALLSLRQLVSAKHHLNGNITTNGTHAAHTITHTKAKIKTHVIQRLTKSATMGILPACASNLVVWIPSLTDQDASEAGRPTSQRFGLPLQRAERCEMAWQRIESGR